MMGDGADTVRQVAKLMAAAADCGACGYAICAEFMQATPSILPRVVQPWLHN
jgi:bacterioferritin-associated ferredoxin